MIFPHSKEKRLLRNYGETQVQGRRLHSKAENSEMLKVRQGTRCMCWHEGAPIGFMMDNGRANKDSDFQGLQWWYLLRGGVGAACFSEACSAIDRMQTVIVKSALIKKEEHVSLQWRDCVNNQFNSFVQLYWDKLASWVSRRDVTGRRGLFHMMLLAKHE